MAKTATKVVNVIGHSFRKNSPRCPRCNAGPEKQVVRKYDPVMHDGDVHCKVCGEFIRHYDAG